MVKGIGWIDIGSCYLLFIIVALKASLVSISQSRRASAVNHPATRMEIAFESYLTHAPASAFLHFYFLPFSPRLFPPPFFSSRSDVSLFFKIPLVARRFILNTGCLFAAIRDDENNQTLCPVPVPPPGEYYRPTDISFSIGRLKCARCSIFAQIMISNWRVRNFSQSPLCSAAASEVNPSFRAG